jgi:hypothetical protein
MTAVTQRWLSAQFLHPISGEAMALQDILDEEITSGVGDDHEGRGVLQDTLMDAVQRLGIEGRKTFV